MEVYFKVSMAYVFWGVLRGGVMLTGSCIVVIWCWCLQMWAVCGLACTGGNLWHPSFPPCFHCMPLSLHLSKEDSISPSLPSTHPITRTSTAFLCPPKLNSTLMSQCFLPLPCLDAALASEARSTGRGVGMACRAGGDLGVLPHLAADEWQLLLLAIAVARLL